MTISMYQASVPVFVRMMSNLANILEKAAAHAEARKFDPAVLLNSRLFPDMFALTRQVQVVSDTAKGCGARLAGIEVPKYEDNETTFAELVERLRKTAAFLETLQPDQIDGSEDRVVTLPTRNGPVNFQGLPYLLTYALPNFYFHLTTAYNILRHNGVEIGMMDYLGPRGRRPLDPRLPSRPALPRSSRTRPATRPRTEELVSMKIEMEPIGHVEAARAEPRDDFWGGEQACIVLADRFEADALQGLETFSHAEVLFFFDQVDPSKIVSGARHPRNDPQWPAVGIFAQRGKNRPNRIGSTLCRVLRLEGRRLYVAELDAIDGTPVLDIKPVMSEFLPRDAVRQPAWSHALMQHYWQKK
jgi:hypothetical protein